MFVLFWKSNIVYIAKNLDAKAAGVERSSATAKRYRDKVNNLIMFEVVWG